jgi:hypothetical protein
MTSLTSILAIQTNYFSADGQSADLDLHNPNRCSNSEMKKLILSGDMHRAVWNCHQGENANFFVEKIVHYVSALGNVLAGLPALITRLAVSLLLSPFHSAFVNEAREQGNNSLALLGVVVKGGTKAVFCIATFLFHDTFRLCSQTCAKAGAPNSSANNTGVNNTGSARRSDPMATNLTT